MDFVKVQEALTIKFVGEEIVLWFAHLYFNINKKVQCMWHSISPRRIKISMTEDRQCNFQFCAVSSPLNGLY